MPDITMCSAVGCPLAPTCHRSEESGTRPSAWRQAWAAYAWTALPEGGFDCAHYRRADALPDALANPVNGRGTE